jgi:hypothetical protein
MDLLTIKEDSILKDNQSSWTEQIDSSSRQIPRSQHCKSLTYMQIIEICFLILILIEHTIVFALTFGTKSFKKNRM